jgi:hypothetical protein
MRLYNDWHLDSLRVELNTLHVKRVNLPLQQLIAEGVVLKEFKEKALEIPFHNSKYFVLQKSWRFKNSSGSNIVILISSKCSDNYFKGIDLQCVTDILVDIQHRNLVSFNEKVNKIVNYLKVKDLDICSDYLAKKTKYTSRTDVEHPNKLYTSLKDKFVQAKEMYLSEHETVKLSKGVEIYDTAKGFMLQFNRRANSTAHTPFLKYYDKSLELCTKERDFLQNSDNLNVTKQFLENNLIFRCEYTIYKIEDFKHYNLSNLLVNILDTSTLKWNWIFNDIEYNLIAQKQFVRPRYDLNASELVMLQLMRKIIKLDAENVRLREQVYNNKNEEYIQLTGLNVFKDMCLNQRNRMSKNRYKKRIEHLYYIIKGEF